MPLQIILTYRMVTVPVAGEFSKGTYSSLFEETNKARLWGHLTPNTSINFQTCTLKPWY